MNQKTLVLLLIILGLLGIVVWSAYSGKSIPIPLPGGGSTTTEDFMEDEKKDAPSSLQTVKPSSGGTQSKPQTSVPKPQGTVISYTSSGFTPKTITIEQGKSITFVNNSSGAMRVMSDPHPGHDYADFTQTQSVPRGGKATFTLLRVGAWGYHNENALWDQGFVTVTPQIR